MEQSIKASVAFLGDATVGKTSLVYQFLTHKWLQFGQPSKGATFYQKNFSYKPEKSIKFQIWDIGGDKQIRHILPTYYKLSQVALCVYDITSKNSFHVLKNLVEELKAKGPKQLILAIVGNKIDKTEDEQVPYSEAKQYAQSINAIFMLTSAKQGKGVNELFTVISQKLEEKQDKKINKQIIIEKKAENNDQESVRQAKVVVLGDTCVGKSSLLIQFVNNQFNSFLQPTLGAAFLSKQLEYKTGKNIKFQIWDTAGNQKYKSIAPIYYNKSQIALCVYDITSKNSFHVLKNWVEELQAKGPKQLILAIVGNKIDKTEDEQVPYSEAKQYAQSINAIFMLTSAKQGKGVNELFTVISQKLEEKQDKKINKQIIIEKKAENNDQQ